MNLLPFRHWIRNRLGALISHGGNLGCLLIASTCLAGAELITESDWLSEIPKVVSATRQEQSIIHAPSSVTIINREMIDALGALNIAELMRLVPGFQVFYTNGSTFGVTPHGFSDRDPRRMEVRVNGRSVYLPLLSSTAWESLGITPEDIDHIEVVRGSNVPAYGSNAILGAINIITLNPVKGSGDNVKVTAGSVNTRAINTQHYFQQGAVDGLLRSAYKENNGFDGVEDESHAGHLAVSGVYTPDLANSLEFEIGYSHGNFGIGDGDHLDEFADEDRNSWWLQGIWEHTCGKTLWKLNTSFANHSFDRHRAVLLSDLLFVPPEQIPAIVPGHEDEALELEQGDIDFNVFNAELERHASFAGGWRSVLGAGLRLDSVKSDRFLGNDGKSDSAVYSLFGNLEWHASPKWIFNGGLMLEDKEGFPADLSTRLSLNHQFTAQQHVRASLTRAFRQPAIMESERLWTIRFSNGDLIDIVHRSHPDIESERVDTAELGYFGFWHNNRLKLDAKIFREEIRDAIDGVDMFEDQCLNPAPAFAALAEEYCQSFFVGDEYGAPLEKKMRVFSNAASWTVEGVELQLRWKLAINTWLRFNYARLEAEGKRVRSVSSLIKEVTDSVPKHTAGLLFSHKLTENWQLSGFLQYTDTVAWRSGTRVESYSRFDLKLARQWRWGKTESELAVMSQNLFDEDYLEYQRNNRFDRRTFLSFSIKWP